MSKDIKKKNNKNNSKTKKKETSKIRKNVVKAEPQKFEKSKRKNREKIDILKGISEYFINNTTKISLIHFATISVTLLIILIVMPFIFNIPFNTINTAFDLKISGAYYFVKFIMFDVLALLLIFVLHHTFLKPIIEWGNDPKNAKYNNLKTSERIRNSSIFTPYIMFIVESILPTILVLILNVKNIKLHPEFVLKLSLFSFAFSIIAATLSYIFTEKIYREFLETTYREGLKVQKKFSLKNKILMYVLPLFLGTFILVSITGYSYNIKSNLSIWHSVYIDSLNKTFAVNDNYNYPYTHQRIKNLLTRMQLSGGKDNVSIFILDKESNVTSISGENPSVFMKRYILDLYNKEDGIAYAGYAFDTQAAVKRVETDKGIEYACIMYSSKASDAILIPIIFIVAGIILVYVSISVYMASLAKDLSKVAKEIDFVSSNNEKDAMNNIRIITNDELAEIKDACNRFQAIKKGNLEMIENNQDLLHFASLGQTTSRMINNVYEPVQNILKENRFLSNTVVTLHDARTKEEINMHSEKIKSNAMYVNEIISAIKGHTTTISENKVYPFNVTDLFKQVALLTKANFISSGTKLSVENPVNPRVLIYGNIDIMVQILSNMASNAINQYDKMGNPKKEIKLSAMLDNDKNNILISIKDYGPGLSKEVQNKLFKEIIKDEAGGSGLGLYIAYENIKTHFHGTVDYETSSEGTTFLITVPIYKR